MVSGLMTPATARLDQREMHRDRREATFVSDHVLLGCNAGEHSRGVHQPPRAGDWAMPRKPPPSDAIPIFRFSTDAFPERERISAWREIFGRTVVNLDVEPLKADGFRAEATVCQLPGLGVLRASSAA